MRHRGAVELVVFSPDGAKVATGSDDDTAVVWNGLTGQPLTPALRHELRVASMAWGPDGLWIATVSADRSLRIWDVPSGNPLTAPLKHESNGVVGTMAIVAPSVRAVPH